MIYAYSIRVDRHGTWWMAASIRDDGTPDEEPVRLDASDLVEAKRIAEKFITARHDVEAVEWTPHPGGDPDRLGACSVAEAVVHDDI